jgi:hypothetical protein
MQVHLERRSWPIAARDRQNKLLTEAERHLSFTFFSHRFVEDGGC